MHGDAQHMQPQHPEQERLPKIMRLARELDLQEPGSKAGQRQGDQHQVEKVTFTLNPRQIRMTRLLISEAEHVPELADNFHDRVMAKCQTYVAAAIERIAEEGTAPEIDDVRSRTMALLGAALGELHLFALFGKSEQFDNKQIAAHVDASLRVCGFSRDLHNDSAP